MVAAQSAEAGAAAPLLRGIAGDQVIARILFIRAADLSGAAARGAP
jgi:hypothetical protein